MFTIVPSSTTMSCAIEMRTSAQPRCLPAPVSDVSRDEVASGVVVSVMVISLLSGWVGGTSVSRPRWRPEG